jgi:hypothetical protein
MRKTVTRYHVRDRDGNELTVPSLTDLHALYAHGFLTDDDWVRSERSQRWVPAGQLDALAGARETRTTEPRNLLAFVAALVALAIGIGLLIAR